MYRISTTIDGKNEEDLVSKTSSLDVPNVDCFQVPTLSASEGESTKSLNGILSPAYMTSIWRRSNARGYTLVPVVPSLVRNATFGEMTAEDGQ
jgi:hypothetical protein